MKLHNVFLNARNQKLSEQTLQKEESERVLHTVAEIVLATNMDRFDMLDAMYEPGNLYHTYGKQCLCILEHVTIELVFLECYHVTGKLRALGFCQS